MTQQFSDHSLIPYGILAIKKNRLPNHSVLSTLILMWVILTPPPFPMTLLYYKMMSFYKNLLASILNQCSHWFKNE